MSHDILVEMGSRSRALYNTALYQIRKEYDASGNFLNMPKLDKLLKTQFDHNNICVYRLLPAQISQHLLRNVESTYKSFFSLLKKKNTNEYDKKVELPNYMKHGEFKEIYLTKSSTGGSFSFKDGWIYITVPKDLHKGRLKLCKIPKYIRDVDFKDIKQLVIYSKGNHLVLNIKYQVKEIVMTDKMDNWMSVDLGINNLMSCVSNQMNAFLINGKPLKSINQQSNKRIAKAQSLLPCGVYSSKEISRLYTKRGNQLNNEIHKITDFITKAVSQHGIDIVIIGYNKGWKTTVKMGKKNNQKFVRIPFAKILQQLEYKLRLIGVKLQIQEESYTSKTSYLDNEPVKKHKTYKGKRTKRGLFKSNNGTKLNADINGALNIYRKFKSKLKETCDALLPADTGLVMNPRKVTIKSSSSIDDVFNLIDNCLNGNRNIKCLNGI